MNEESTPRELMLLRHGKSDWNAGLPDFDRPINARGRKAAELMGRFARESGCRPDALYVSPAVRARQTAERFCREAGIELDAVRWCPGIYEADLADLLAVVAEAAETVSARVLLIGHNPGLETLLRWLCPNPSPPGGSKLMPTAALVRIGLGGDWTNPRPGSGRVLSHVTPRSLDFK
jgi:phosphohistidine phosphatase